MTSAAQRPMSAERDHRRSVEPDQAALLLVSRSSWPYPYQAYRPGQEQQLGALGLVTNVLTLWNSGYMDHAVEHLRSEGTTIANEDLEHLSPLQHEHVNLHGRYVFSAPDHLRHGPLRPLTTHGGR